MAGWKRRILGIIVISGGVCAALPFRTDTSSLPLKPSDAPEFSRDVGTQSELTLRLTIPSGTEVSAIPVSDTKVLPTVLEASLTGQTHTVSINEIQVPPPVGSTFESFSIPQQSAAEVTTPSVDEPERKHRVADGDTLRSLAARYLGDESAWRAIFEGNTKLLTDPDVLPIGHDIRIPSTTKSLRNEAASDEDDGLVPIPADLLNREPR